MPPIYEQTPQVRDAVFDRISTHQQDAASCASTNWLEAVTAISDVKKAVKKIPAVAMPADYMASVVATLNTQLEGLSDSNCGQEYLKALRTDLGRISF